MHDQCIQHPPLEHFSTLSYNIISIFFKSLANRKQKPPVESIHVQWIPYNKVTKVRLFTFSPLHAKFLVKESDITMARNPDLTCNLPHLY